MADKGTLNSSRLSAKRQKQFTNKKRSQQTPLTSKGRPSHRLPAGSNAIQGNCWEPSNTPALTAGTTVNHGNCSGPSQTSPVRPDNQLAAESTAMQGNCSGPSLNLPVRSDNHLATESIVSQENCSGPSQTSPVRPDNQLAAASTAMQGNCSGTSQTPAVRSDNQLAAGSTVIQENCSGTTLVGSGNHVHYHFHLHCDTCGFHAEHTEHRQWAEHHIEALGRGLQQLQLPPCDNNNDEVSEEEEEAVESPEAAGNVASNHSDSKGDQKLENRKKRSLFSFLFKMLSRSSVAEDTVSIIDSKGRVLEPGDAVWTEMFGFTWAVYVGHQDIVLCQRPDKRVVKEKLDLTQPFEKLRVVSEGDVRASPRGEVIRRAKSRVGTKFTEGDWFGSDFHVWAMTGMGAYQAGRRGFRLYRD